MEERTVPIRKLRSWLKKYNNTQRHYWLHPWMLEYEANITGARIQPLESSVFNDDSDPLVIEAKRQYFSSPSFRKLPLEDRKTMVAIIGMPDSIIDNYKNRTSFKWLFESEKDLKSIESIIDEKDRGDENNERTNTNSVPL